MRRDGAAGSPRRTATPTSRSRICRSASSARRAARRAAVSRSATRFSISPRQLELGLFDGATPPRRRRPRPAPRSTPCSRSEARRASGAAAPHRRPARRRGQGPRQGRSRCVRELLHRAADCRLHVPCRDRRLHRLLRRHQSRDQCRQAVPARQSADAELQIRADRLSRPRVVDRGLGRRRAPPQRPAQTGERNGPDLRPLPQPRLRARARRLDRARQRPRAVRSRSRRPPTTSPASVCSTTGRRATSRAGSTSRSARSSARASAPPSRRGWSRRKRWRRSA